MNRCKRGCPFPDKQESEINGEKHCQSVHKRLCVNNVYQTRITMSSHRRSDEMDWQEESHIGTQTTSKRPGMTEVFFNNNNNINNNNNSLPYGVCSRCQSGEGGHYGHIGR